MRNDGRSVDVGTVHEMKYKMASCYSGRPIATASGVSSTKFSRKKLNPQHQPLKTPTSFNLQDRFLDYKALARKTPRVVGPGYYNIQKSLSKLKQKPCLAKFEHSYFGKIVGQAPGYIMVGN